MKSTSEYDSLYFIIQMSIFQIERKVSHIFLCILLPSSIFSLSLIVGGAQGLYQDLSTDNIILIELEFSHSTLVERSKPAIKPLGHRLCQVRYIIYTQSQCISYRICKDSVDQLPKRCGSLVKSITKTISSSKTEPETVNNVVGVRPCFCFKFHYIHYV